MESTAISFVRKDLWVTEVFWFQFKSLSGYWFSVPHGYLPQKPLLYPVPQGIWLGGRKVHSLLVTTDFYDMIMTDADAILADFYWIPPQRKLHELFSVVRKPVVIYVRKNFFVRPKLTATIKRLEVAGAAGLFVGRRFRLAELKQACLASSVPVFAASRPKIEDIKSKIDAGVFAVCIQAKRITGKFMELMRHSFPNIPVIAFCNRSERLVGESVKSGPDAVFFRPCIPFDFHDRMEF